MLRARDVSLVAPVAHAVACVLSGMCAARFILSATCLFATCDAARDGNLAWLLGQPYMANLPVPGKAASKLLRIRSCHSVLVIAAPLRVVLRAVGARLCSTLNEVYGVRRSSCCIQTFSGTVAAHSGGGGESGSDAITCRIVSMLSGAMGSLGGGCRGATPKSAFHSSS